MSSPSIMQRQLFARPALLLAALLCGAATHALGHDHQMFGISVAGLGDVDGDEKPDLAVGDPAHPAAGDWAGRVWILSSKSWRTLHVVSGTRAAESLGTTLAGAGDIDGDATPDLLIGAADSSGDTHAQVLACSGASGKLLYTIELPAEDRPKVPWFSSAQGPPMVGIVDGDGRADFAVGVPFGDARACDAGTLQCRSGATGALLFEVHGEAACDRFGTSVAALGDLDGDGFPDLAAGAMPDFDEPPADEACEEYRPGYVTLISGKDGKLLRTIRAPDGSYRFGVTVTGTGDLDGDGSSDVAVARTFWDCVPQLADELPLVADGQRTLPKRGPRVWAFSGRDGSLIRDWHAWSQEDAFGARVLELGDLNRDGLPELLITAPSSFGSKASVAVYSGARSSQLRSFANAKAWEESHYGVSAAVIGDLDGDGAPEMAVGAASIRGGGGYPGAVHVLSTAAGAELAHFTRAKLEHP